MKTEAVERKGTKIEGNKVLAAKLGFLAALSYFLPQSQILGGISPFAICLTACLPLKYAWLTALGSCLGYLIKGLEQNTILYLIVLAFVFAMKVIFRNFHFTRKLAFSASLSLYGFLIVYIVSYFMFEFTPVDMALRVCESIIACGITCFLYLATNAMLQRGSMMQFSQIELASTGIMAMLGIVSLCTVSIYQLNLGIVFGTVCLYIIISRLGAVGGAVGGILLALSLNLYSMDFINLSAIVLVAGFLAGIFKMLGKLGQVAIFLSVSVFCTFIVGLNMNMLFHLVSIVIASGLFLAIPERMLSWFAIAGLNNDSRQQDSTMKDNIENRLSFAAETIRDLQNSLQKVSNKLDRMEGEDITNIYNKTATSVCQSCALKLSCWDEHYLETAEAFQAMMKQVQQKNVITPEFVKRLPQLNCCRPVQLSEALYQNYQAFSTRDLTNRHISEIRGLAVEQLSGVSQMLWEVSEEISDIQSNEANASNIVSDIFTELAVKPKSVFCNLNKYERMEIEIDTLTGVEIDLEQLRHDISGALKRQFAPPSVSKISNKLRVSLYEVPTYLAEFGAYQITNEKDEICGDSYEYFLDSKGNAYLILSDGMGSGRHAALDSTMTCGIILKLIKAGFGLDSIIKFVNSSLQVKSSDESLSTIDVAKVDLYTGQVDFFKAGSASSFVVMNHKVAKVETNSLPVGILQGIEFDKKSVMVADGDVVVIISDGILEIGDTAVSTLIHQNLNLSCEELSKTICREVKSQLPAHDDLTALVLRLNTGV